MECSFEKMKIVDLHEVLGIEKESFSQPWTLPMFENEILKNPFSEQILIKIEGKIVGYLFLWSLFDESHLLDLAIHPQYRRKGLGQKAILHVIGKIKQKNIKKMFLEVRESNQPAIALYKKLGFTRIAVRKGYYANPKEDAIIFQWTDSKREHN